MKKNSLEYTCKNSHHRDPIFIRLEDYSLVVRHGSREETIAYASIVSVRVDKSLDHVYRVHLQADGYSPIEITSKGMSDDNSEGKSREYALFVRVLHHHLKEKSQAVFRSGGNFNHFWQWVTAIAVLSLAVSLSAEYAGVSLMNAYAQALIIASLTIVILFVLKGNKLPKAYSPTNIPLQYLP